MRKHKKYFIFAAVILLLLALAPFASSFPDGLEWVMENKASQFQALQDEFWKFAPWSDYKVSFIQNESLTTILAGAFGVVISFAATMLYLRSLKRQKFDS